MKGIVQRLAGRCETHDRPASLVIAQLEAETGVDPDAVVKLFWNAASLTASFADPRLIDCGNPRCRKRREGQR